MLRSARLFRYTIVKRKYGEIPSVIPPCCPDSGSKEKASGCGDNEESLDGVNPDFSELMDFDEVMGGKLTTSAMALSQAEEVIDGFDMDLYPFSSDTSRLDSGLTASIQSGGAPTHDVCTSLFNQFNHGSAPSLQKRPLLVSPGVPVLEQQKQQQQQRRMSLYNQFNQNSSSDAIEKQNLPRDAQNLRAADVESCEVVDSICGSPLKSSNSRTIITLEEADPSTVMEMMDIALRSKAKVKFENC